MATSLLAKRLMHTTTTELHTHSTHSDGLYDVVTLAAKVAKAGVSFWSLTDHDTCAGVEEARQEATKLAVQFVSGIEVSAWEGRSVHVLGYGVDVVAMSEYSEHRSKLREERMAAMVAKLNTFGFRVTLQDVEEEASGAILTRPHLARTLVRLGYSTNVGEAFDHYLGNGRPAYVETEWPSVEEAIAIIHAAHGVAIVAHPGIYGLDHRIPHWVDAGLDGIEVGHPKHSDAQRDNYRDIAETLGILKTASSDYHGPAPGAVELGKTRIPEAWSDALLARLDKQ